MPRMPFIGVRISWLMFARKSLFGLCGLLGFLPGRADGFLRALALGNVAPNSMNQPPAMLLDGRQQDFDREDLTIGAAVQPLEAEAAELQHLRH